MIDHALQLAHWGFHVFPLRKKSKLPLIKDFPTLATRDIATIKDWWTKAPEANIGISTTKFGDGEALVVIDVDNKGKKKGDDELLKLEMEEGLEVPVTFTQRTPTGGRHLVYRSGTPVKQGTSVLGPGLDIRSRGGYIVGVGSRIGDGVYTCESRDVRGAPEWLISRCGGSVQGNRREQVRAPEKVDRLRAWARATQYLVTEAPLAYEGAGGDQKTFVVAARLKDFGLDEKSAVAALLEYWNDRCEPPWPADELEKKVANAYRYGVEPVGGSAPEADFVPVEPSEELHPFEVLNKEFAFVIAGGGSHILWETTDARGSFKLDHLSIRSFHEKFASHTMTIGEKTKPVTELWIKSDRRRSYDGICFMPGLAAPERFYNLWRGFTVEPFGSAKEAPKAAHEALQMFQDHALKNVCRGEQSLYAWLMGYFAHLVQRPWEKPLTALVFRGGKGVGKNALLDRVGYLLGGHYLLSSDRRYLVGNFNGHLENLLLLGLDEAFWSGDKSAEGTLKGLITGRTHVIEHKGKEPYQVDNCTRVAIIGNEEWLVPATQDERRFAVFDVGDGRKQDRTFFKEMREKMEAGGYRLLLRYLLDFDLSGIDVNDAPKTEALLDQKIRSLEPFHQWWFECLNAGVVVASDFNDDSWAKELKKDSFRHALRKYSKDRGIEKRIPDERSLGKLLWACCPGVTEDRKTINGDRTRVYVLPSLEDARASWEKFIGHKVKWEA